MHRATRRRLRHHMGWRVPLLLLAALVVLWPICASDAEGLLCAFFGGALALLVLLVVVAYLVRDRRGVHLARKLSTRAFIESKVRRVR